MGGVNEVVGADPVQPGARQPGELLVGEPERARKEVLLVVLEVDHVRSVEDLRRPLGRLANHLARGPGADHGLLRLAGPAAQEAVEALVVDAFEAGLPDRFDPLGRTLPAERHLDARGRHLLSQVKSLDHAVHVELAVVQEEDPQLTVSLSAISCGSPPNGGKA